MPRHPASMRTALAVVPGPVNLAGYDPAARPRRPAKGRGLQPDLDHLRALQERLWAEASTGGQRRILLVLQGIDTAGKGGVTEHVVGSFGAIGVQYTAFKRPTPEEAAHHFLWRIRKHVPGPGVIGVFDRSHYEDVLVPRVHETLPEAEWRARYDEINAFEAELVGSGVIVVKCFLHISYETQRKRLLARLDTRDKRWKFHDSDLAERARWVDYQAAYQEMLERCSTTNAPWFVVPSDAKTYRNWAVSELLRETLEELGPQYPNPYSGKQIKQFKARLAPPN